MTERIGWNINSTFEQGSHHSQSSGRASQHNPISTVQRVNYCKTQRTTCSELTSKDFCNKIYGASKNQRRFQRIFIFSFSFFLFSTPAFCTRLSLHNILLIQFSWIFYCVAFWCEDESWYEGVESFIYRTKNVFCMYVECNLIYALFSLLPDVMEKKKSMVLNCLPDLLDLLYRGGGCAHNNNEIIFHRNLRFHLWSELRRPLQ